MSDLHGRGIGDEPFCLPSTVQRGRMKTADATSRSPDDAVRVRWKRVESTLLASLIAGGGLRSTRG